MFTTEINALLVSFISGLFGIIYGTVFWWTKKQSYSNWIAIPARLSISAVLFFYLLNFYELSFILLALPIFLATFWITVFKLER